MNSPSPNAGSPGSAKSRETLLCDQGWRFHLGDVPMPVVSGHQMTYLNAKAGITWGAAAKDFDDSDWRVLDLPHDWVVEGPFDPKANIAQGYRPRGIAWYRRHFRLEEEDRGKHLELQFDGIATHAKVWVNGLLVHRNHCGYTPFQIDITPIAEFGDRLNTVAVRVDAEEQEGWWYEGGGIYRHTWLIKRPPVHLQTDGVHVCPERDHEGRWNVTVEAVVDNIGRASTEATVTAELLGAGGDVVSATETRSRVDPLSPSCVRMDLNLTVPPRLWSPDSPSMYAVRVRVRDTAGCLDEAVVPCGFRTLRFDPNHGFFLNEEPLKIQGTCNHQDHAGVGVAVPDALWDFRVRRLKEMGCNAYRCAHHPPAREFLDACDRLGMLVMDENRVFNHTPEYLGQVRAMVRRDRNHPCVFLWSVFNEEPMQGTPQGREMVRRMVAEVRRLDSSRPVTAAMNGGMDNEEGVFEAVDVMGFNYAHHSYDSFHGRHPHLPLLSSEDTSAFMTRGEFENDTGRNVIASYDCEHASWGLSHREAWKVIAERPFLAGGFVWTGFDYRGEPQRLEWPSVSSVFGIMDTCGFPKTAFWIHQAEWVKDRPVIAIAPHWNWQGREGHPIRVLVMTNCASAELFLNGVSLGFKTRAAYDVLEWNVPYAPGRLEAVAFDGAAEVARTAVETTGPAAAVVLEPDRQVLSGDGRDAMPVTVSVVDAEGRVVPGADNEITFHIAGPGENIGHGNGDHNSHAPEKGATRHVFHGLAQLIVRSRPGSGVLTIRATSTGLREGLVHLEVHDAPPPPSLPAAVPVFAVSAWRAAPASSERPDPSVAMSGDDVNTWASVTPGTLQSVSSDSWVLYRAAFTPWRSLDERGGVMRFASFHGTCEVWIGGTCVGIKTEPRAENFECPIAPGVREVTLLARPIPGGEIGFGGSVTLREPR